MLQLLRLYFCIVAQNVFVSAAATSTRSFALHSVGKHAISLVDMVQAVGFPKNGLQMYFCVSQSRSISLKIAAPPKTLHCEM